MVANVNIQKSKFLFSLGSTLVSIVTRILTGLNIYKILKYHIYLCNVRIYIIHGEHILCMNIYMCIYIRHSNRENRSSSNLSMLLLMSLFFSPLTKKDGLFPGDFDTSKECLSRRDGPEGESELLLPTRAGHRTIVSLGMTALPLKGVVTLAFIWAKVLLPEAFIWRYHTQKGKDDAIQ